VFKTKANNLNIEIEMRKIMSTITTTMTTTIRTTTTIVYSETQIKSKIVTYT